MTKHEDLHDCPEAADTKTASRRNFIVGAGAATAAAATLAAPAVVRAQAPVRLRFQST
ncbi:hypothetical protein FHS85_003274 [Rhodoligotrophos appendicifer]